MIYVTESDWKKISSLTINDKKKLILFESIYNIMKSINSKIKFSNQIVLSTAMIYFHKFFIFNNYSVVKGIDRLFFCSSCIFLATKVINRLVSLNYIASVLLELIQKSNKPRSVSREEIKNKIIDYEFTIISSLGFNLEVDLPYKFIVKVKAFFEAKQLNLNIKKIIELYWYYINDSFMLPLCLYYTPYTISVASIWLLIDRFHILVDKNEILLLSDEIIHVENVQECYNSMMKIYEKDDEPNQHTKGGGVSEPVAKENKDDMSVVAV